MGVVKESVLVYVLILIGLFYYKPDLLNELSQYKFALPILIMIVSMIAYYIVSLKSMIHFGPP